MEAHKLRFDKLSNERMLELKREGVVVSLVRFPSSYHIGFAFHPDDSARVKELIGQSRFALDVCDREGKTIVKYKAGQLALNHQSKNMVTGQSQRALLRFEIGHSFYLAKHNPTINAHQQALAGGNFYSGGRLKRSQAIVDFINGKTTTIPAPEPINFEPQADLNNSQNEAIRLIGLNKLTYVKGPPGCGKTRTISRLCRLCVQKRQQVLVGTVSNTGNVSLAKELISELGLVNNHTAITELMNSRDPQVYADLLRSSKIDEWMPVKLLVYTPMLTLQQYGALDPLLRFYSITTHLVRIFLRTNSTATLEEIYSIILMVTSKTKQGSMYLPLFKDAQAVALQNCDIMVSTTVLISSVRDVLKVDYSPDVVILDEASQASWGDSLCFINLDPERVVLVGDERQLDPTVISQDKLLKQTVISVLTKKSQCSVMLNIQYRMHPVIASLPNWLFYASQLLDGVTAQERSSPHQFFQYYPLSFMHHQQPEIEVMAEERPGVAPKKNYLNLADIFIIKHFLKQMTNEQMPHIGIITPYASQANKIKEILACQVEQGLTVRTCDGYQGGEKDYIFFSCVRSNEEEKIGFCGEHSRVNVSLTRAKRGMVIIGNMLTLEAATLPGKHNPWEPICRYMRNFNMIIFFEETYQKMSKEELESMEQKSKAYAEFKLKAAAEPSDHQKYEQYYYKDKNKVTEELKPQSKPTHKDLSLQLRKLASEWPDEDPSEDQERLIKMNKAEARYIRQMTLFRQSKDKTFDIENTLTQLTETSAKMGESLEELGARMPRDTALQLASRLEKTTSDQHQLELRSFVESISPEVYSSNHLIESKNVATLVRQCLLTRLLSLSQ